MAGYILTDQVQVVPSVPVVPSVTHVTSVPSVPSVPVATPVTSAPAPGPPAPTSLPSVTPVVPVPTVTAVPPVVVLNKQRLQELVTEIDPSEQLDEDVEDYLLQMTDDFIEKLVTDSCQVARHRGSSALEVKDIQLILEKYYNMIVPGFGPQLTALNRLKSHSAITEAHKQRVALIKRTLKKF